jgi:hypothetical protein
MILGATVPGKHFLDTSVVRPVMHGTTVYKNYFQGVFGNNSKYVSPFVEMEFTRSYLVSLIDFYFILRLPTLDTIADAMAFASNQYRASKLKSALQLAGQLFEVRGFQFNSSVEKPRALFALADVIFRVHTKFHRTFTNTGRDSTRCARATIRLNIDLQNAEAEFRRFSELFEDTETCRSKCSIDRFFTRRHKKMAEKCVQEAKELKSSPDTTGFKEIGNHLEKILETKGKVCSCRLCGNVGDAVIALDCDREMTLHHVDKSFNQLCAVMNQLHSKHPSETAVVKHGPTEPEKMSGE